MPSNDLSLKLAAALAAFSILQGFGEVHAQPRKTIQATIGNKVETGRPLASDGQRLVLLRRDGSLKTIQIDSATDIKTVSNHFQPYSFEKCVKRLSEIYGSRYQVTRTKHFVIVHPRGKQQQWASFFETIFVQFRSYFSSRGFQVQTPEFPLIAVVYEKRSEYDAYTVRRGSTPRQQIVGYYMPANNRIVTYNQSLNGANTNTLVHEITHQVAFNSGVQNRYAQPPVWICEGLAVMFEARGVRDSQKYPKLEDHVHGAHLQNFLRISQDGKMRETLRSIVTGDRVFRSDTSNAYSTAWALTYYLSQTRSEALNSYLRELAARKDFTGYSSEKRWADFAKHFGSDIDDLEYRLKQYFANKK